MSAQIIQLRPRRRPECGTSLSDEDCFAVAAALTALPGGWLAQRDEYPDGTVSMTLLPAEEEEDTRSFVVRREPCGYRLNDGTPDAPLGKSLGCYGSLAGLMHAARRALGLR